MKLQNKSISNEQIIQTKPCALSIQLVELGNYLGILEYDADEYLKQGSELSESDISKKIEQREEARSSKDFAMSDQIRDELFELGIILEDSVMEQLGEENNLKLDWDHIDTVLLDLDGTLLDLNFDLRVLAWNIFQRFTQNKIT